jgi:hypothetical protein
VLQNGYGGQDISEYAEKELIFLTRVCFKKYKATGNWL